jgi:hypothetical protein
VMYVPLATLQQRAQENYFADSQQMSLVPLSMLFCPRDGSGGPHCGYGGVDTSEEAYADPDPLAIIGEGCTKENRLSHSLLAYFDVRPQRCRSSVVCFASTAFTAQKHSEIRAYCRLMCLFLLVRRWDCTFPGPKNYGPDSPAIWLPEDDVLEDPTLVRKVWPDYPPPSKKKLLLFPQILRATAGA